MSGFVNKVVYLIDWPLGVRYTYCICVRYMYLQMHLLISYFSNSLSCCNGKSLMLQSLLQTDKKHKVCWQLSTDGGRVPLPMLDDCHTLTLVFFVSFVILVRSGCDMGDVCVFVLSRGFVCLWVCFPI